jgi:hypothetical protein
MRIRRTVVSWAVLVLVLGLATGAAGRSSATGTEHAGMVQSQGGACGMPTASPVWIDYGEASVRPDTRAVLARPGVVVATSGTAVPAQFRSQGAATPVYFVLHLPRIAGQPTSPVDPATIPDAATKLLAQAQASTACATPWIALNELAGPGAKAPWSASVAQYRANLLALVQALAAGGAHPVLLVHGDPTVAGATADWWRQVAQSADIVYEAYYDATRIYPMGSLMGTRRMRMGIRNVVALFESVGIPPARLGIMLGFHSAQTPGIAGRQGLQPREAWLRVVKWEAFATRQVALEEHLSSIWSWGWGTFGPESVDADKSVAACTYLWARNPALCDAPAMAGPAFNTSRVEGQIVVPKTAACTLAGRHVELAAVDRLTALTRDPQQALTAQFTRAALSGVGTVKLSQVRAVEQAVVARSFHGSWQAYRKALARRHATVAIARGVIVDELQRRNIAALLTRHASVGTFEWTTALLQKRAETAICRGDVLPGFGDFPASDVRDIGPVQLPALLPFLFRDHSAPAAPAVPTATQAGSGVTLAWAGGREPDLAGYDVLRSLGGGNYTKLNAVLLPRLSFVDRTLPAGQAASYVVRAVDTSGNRSKLSPPATVGNP